MHILVEFAKMLSRCLSTPCHPPLGADEVSGTAQLFAAIHDEVDSLMLCE
jgi:hypothetical protein